MSVYDIYDAATKRKEHKQGQEVGINDLIDALNKNLDKGFPVLNTTRQKKRTWTNVTTTQRQKKK